MPTVWIPALLRDLTGGQETITVAGTTVRQVIENLDGRYPGVKDRLCAGDQLRPGVAVAVYPVRLLEREGKATLVQANLPVP